ncbi:MAG: hypothetical protein GX459_01330 [Bacteroidales bacterium]|nr:hypothetical protein [Bacteroidales bacterium]
MKGRLYLLIFPIVLGCMKDYSDDDYQSDIIPDEVAHKKGYIQYLTPPNNFKAVTGWITAIHDKRSPEDSWIEIDYIRIYARFNGSDKLLSKNEYNDGIAEGGLFMRQPWFGSNYNIPIPYEFSSSGCLILRTSSKPDNVWHVWNKQWPRAVVPPNIERCWLEVKCRITGSALIQLGLDYWREPTSFYAGYNVNNIEAGVSDWYFKSGEWVILDFAKP